MKIISQMLTTLFFGVIIVCAAYAVWQAHEDRLDTINGCTARGGVYTEMNSVGDYGCFINGQLAPYR